MSQKRIALHVLLAALVVGLGANLASAGWVEHFDGTWLDSAWTHVFPATEDGYYAGTGRDTAAGMTVAGSAVTVSSITGGTNGLSHLMMLERSIAEAGTNDFVATLDFRDPYNEPDTNGIEFKIMDTSGNIIAATSMLDISKTTWKGGSRFHRIFSPTTTPKDINNDDGILDTYDFPITPSWVGRFSIERTNNLFTAHMWAGATYDTMSLQYNITDFGDYHAGSMGTSSLAVGSLQVGFQMNVSQTGTLIVDRASFEAVPEPSSIVLSLFAGFGLAAYAWRRRKA